MKSKRGRANGSLEREIIACLAASGAPMTASQVRADLGDDLAYTTVMTTLSRLYDKRALTRSARGRAYAYELVGDTAGVRSSVAAHQMHKLLDAGPDRAGVLSRFVDSLDGESEQYLRALLGDADRHRRP